MKKLALVIALFLLCTAAAGAGVITDDKDFRAGLSSYNSKNYKAAIKYFKEYISKKPDPTAYYLTGYSLYKLGKFSEADEYFRDAFLIDPEYSLEKVGLVKKASGEVAAKEAVIEKNETKPAPAAETRKDQPAKQPIPPAKSSQPALSDTKTGKQGSTAPSDKKSKTAEPATAAAQKPATPAQAAPQQTAQAVPAPQAPAFPAVTPTPKKEMPVAGPAALIAMVAAFGMIVVFIGIAIYVYSSLCLFLIAKKLEVPAPWTAWIPIVQFWTLVASAGKPGWWVLLFLVPIVNLFIAVYLWICITENLNKNKWLGLLILVPIVGIIYPGWLAFSKTERSGGYTPPEETVAE